MDDINLSEKIRITDLLAQQKSVTIHPQGFSMYPLIYPGRDRVTISPIGSRKIKRGDVLLYRRQSGRLILHRVYKIKDSKLFLVGDNQSEIEGPLDTSRVYGIMTEFYHGNAHFSVRNPLYFLSWQIWLFLLPFRKPLSEFIHKIKPAKK